MQTAHIPDNWRWEVTDGRSIAVWDEKGVPRCGALCRNGARKGQACIKSPEHGRYRCNIHQGEKRRGEDNPSFKTGKHSRYFKQIPARLQERYQQLMTSGDLTNLSENIALLDLRLGELMERLDVGSFGAGYNQLRSLHHRANAEMQVAFHGTDADARKDALSAFIGLFNEIGEVVLTGQKDYQIWREILDVTGERRAIAKTMSDIEHRGENSISLAEFMALIENIKDIFEKANRLQTAEERSQELARGINNIIHFDANNRKTG